MPATIINVNATDETIRNAMSQIDNQEEKLQEIEGIINTMEGSWESESQRAYAESFRLSRQRIESFNENFRSELRNMLNFLDDCMTADELTARELRSVSW